MISVLSEKGKKYTEKAMLMKYGRLFRQHQKFDVQHTSFGHICIIIIILGNRLDISSSTN